MAAALAVSAVAGIIAVWGASSLIRNSAGGRTYSDLDTIPHRRVALVLGCSRTLAGGRANLFFNNRIAAAAALFKSGKADYLLVSGDNHVRGYDEATDMKESLVRMGVPAGRIYCDYAGFRTFDSMVRARDVFGLTEITVVSQEFHNLRAIYLASHLGIDAIAYNAPDVALRFGIRTWCRESLARFKTLLDVHVLPAKPRFLGPPISIGEYADTTISVE